MIPYFIIFYCSLLYAIIDFFSRKIFLKYAMIFLFGLTFVLLAGLRWETGTDWNPYLQFFNTIKDVEFGTSGYEILYELYFRFTSTITTSYTFTLIFTCITIFTLNILSVIKYSQYPLFSLLLLLSYSLNSSGFGYRQDIAIAITFFSIHFAINRKFFFFTFFVVIASLIHESAIIFLPAYWIINWEWNKKNFVYLIIFIGVLYFIISKITFISFLYSESAANKVLIYNDLTPEEKLMRDGNPLLVVLRGLANRLFLLAPSILFFFKLNKIEKKFNIFFNLLIFSLILYVLISPLGYVFLRLTRYYDIFHIILLPLTIYYLPPKIKFTFFITFVLYCIFKFNFFILTDPGIYVPYKSIFNADSI